MKCEKCSQENGPEAKFCSACGSILKQDDELRSAAMAATSPVVMNAPITSGTGGGFNNLPPVGSAKKNPAHIVMVVEAILGGLFVIVVVGVIIWSLVGKSGGGEVLKCDKDTKAVSSSVALTYNKGDISKLEMIYIIDKTIDADTLHGTDAEDYMVAGFANMALSKFDGKEGVKYDYSDQRTITTISLEADLTKMKKAEAADLTSDYDGMTMEEVEAEYISDGYKCALK